jgi:hypothetical protein
MNAQDVLNDVFDALKNQLKDEYSRAKGQIDALMETQKNRLNDLVEKRMNEQISQEDFESYLEDEKRMMVAEYNTVSVIGKAAAERAANAALDVLNKTIDKALKAL